MMAALYARVSTSKQDEQLQLPTLRTFAETQGWEIYSEYSDEASGRSSNRPGWKALMLDASQHRFEVVVAVKLDRIMRSLIELQTTVSNLNTYGVKLVTLDLGELDLSTPQGKLTMQIIGAIAEWERNIIVERTKEALAAKAAAGKHLGKLPRADIDVRRAAELRRAGLSWVQIARKLDVPRTTLTDPKRKAMILEISGGAHHLIVWPLGQ